MLRTRPQKDALTDRCEAIFRGAEKQGADALEGGFGGEAVAGAEGFDLAVLDEVVGPADADDGSLDALLTEALKDGAAEAAGEDVVFHGDQELAAGGRRGRCRRGRRAWRSGR